MLLLRRSASCRSRDGRRARSKSATVAALLVTARLIKVPRAARSRRRDDVSTTSNRASRWRRRRSTSSSNCVPAAFALKRRVHRDPIEIVRHDRFPASRHSRRIRRVDLRARTTRQTRNSPRRRPDRTARAPVPPRRSRRTARVRPRPLRRETPRSRRESHECDCDAPVAGPRALPASHSCDAAGTRKQIVALAEASRRRTAFARAPTRRAAELHGRGRARARRYSE